MRVSADNCIVIDGPGEGGHVFEGGFKAIAKCSLVVLFFFSSVISLPMAMLLVPCADNGFAHLPKFLIKV